MYHSGLYHLFIWSATCRCECVSRSQSSAWKHATENCTETFFLFDSEVGTNHLLHLMDGRDRERKKAVRTSRESHSWRVWVYLFCLRLTGICTFAEPSVPSLWPQPLHRLTKHLIFSYSIISATMILKTDGLLMKHPAHEHFLSQVIIFLEKQTKDRFGSLYFSLRWGIGHKRDNWLPKVTKKVCVRARNWFHVSWIPNCSFNYPFLSSKWKHLWISDAGEVI